MPNNTNLESSFWENLKTNYRISVFDVESLKEIRSFKFSVLKLILSFLALFLLVFLLFITIFSIKPIKHMVFGFDSVESSTAFIELNKQVVELENALIDQKVYTKGLLNMLSGDQNTILDSNPEPLDIETAVVTKSNNTTSKPEEEPVYKELRKKLMYLNSPIRGRISAHFNQLDGHLGVDIIAPKDSPISSISDGVVIDASWTIETGHTISVQHADNVISIYKHNSVLLKKSGDYVKAGEAIAIIGNTGEQTTGPHLHFELWHQGMPLDPVQFISF